MIAKVLFFCLLSAFFLTVLGQEVDLGALDQRFQEELSKLNEQRRERETQLRGGYLAALLRFETQARQATDLDGVMESRKEIERVERGGSLKTQDLSKHAEVARLQTMANGQVTGFEKARAEGVVQLARNYAQFLENGSATFTQQGKIEEALAWRSKAQTVYEIDAFVEANRFLGKQEAKAAAIEAATPSAPAAEVHPALRGKPTEIIAKPTTEVSDKPVAYWSGNEPTASEKRVQESTPSAAGTGHTLLTGRLKMIEDKVTNNRYSTGWSSWKSQSLLYVGRVQFGPLPGRSMGKTLVVIDLFKRGSGSKREVIRTDRILLPPLESGRQVVVDSGAYEYNTEKYRSSYSSYRYDYASNDEFYGFVVSFFDETGSLIFQRSSQKALDSYARTLPP